MRERGQDVAAAGTFDQRGVVQVVLPRSPLAENDHVAAREGVDELVVVVRDVGGEEDVAHLLRCGGRDELPAVHEPVEAEELADRRGVGVIGDRVAEPLAVRAVVFADPEAAAPTGIVEAAGVQHLLDLAQAHLARVLRGHLVARRVDHQSELVLRLRVE